MPNVPYIPATITVHLGPPDDAAPDVTVPFPEYIKNVASSEIYPTWPESALRANIYAQISFAMNRVYTSHYRSQGYQFDITSSTAFDQAFVLGRDFFDSVSAIADEVFNSYVRRKGTVEPLFTQYCNGTTVTCAGLSQWGTVELANRGLDSLEILQNYYGEDIELVSNVRVMDIIGPPPYILTLGVAGNEVRTLQLRLNRISTNFPQIPKIYPVNGVYDIYTQNAVKQFQRIFNLTEDGVVGSSTWYRVQYIYNGVKRLGELDSEGVTYEDISLQYPEVLREGDSGIYVQVVQYFLSFVGQYEDAVPQIEIDGYYGPETTAAVKAFQRNYELPVDGIIGVQTYTVLFDVYNGIINSLPDEMFETVARPAPGYILVLGMENEYVRYLQEYLNVIAQNVPQIPPVIVDGIFGPNTRSAVIAFQHLAGLKENGYVNAYVWNEIASLYDNIRAGTYVNYGQFPGYTIQ